MSEDVLAPKQQRSRETLRRLLRATIEMLDKHGLGGATIPRIAAAADVAPASVYRRFQDRDALFRAAFLHVLEQSASGTRSSLRLESFPDKSFEGVVDALIGASIRQYVRYPGLMRAFIRFAEGDTDEAFRARATELIAGNFTAGVDLLAGHFRGEIKHKNAKRAITFALLSAGTIIEERAMEDVSLWHVLLPLSETQLRHELTRMVLAYLR